jgi:hypothetical protein
MGANYWKQVKNIWSCRFPFFFFLKRRNRKLFPGGVYGRGKPDRNFKKARGVYIQRGLFI